MFIKKDYFSDEKMELLGMGQVMKMLNCSRTSLMNLIKNHDLAATKVGVVYKIPKQAVVDYLHQASSEIKYNVQAKRKRIRRETDSQKQTFDTKT